MNEPKTWYYYLHENGDLIGKNPILFQSDPNYFHSPFVQRYWHVNLTDRESMWRMIIEALEKGARPERVKELAEKWKMDFDDLIEFLKRFNLTTTQRDGARIFAKEILEMDPYSLIKLR